MLYHILLVGVFMCVTRAYNIEEKQVHPLYLRNGGSDMEYDPAPPAFAGYTFDAMLRGDNMSLVFGQPREGVADSNSFAGVIYSCNMNIRDVLSGLETNSSSEFSTAGDDSFPREFTIHNCKKLTLFDASSLDRYHEFGTDALGLSLTRIAESDSLAVCASGRRKECPGTAIIASIYRPGACYYGDPVKDSWTLLKWDQQSKCFELDVIFVVDGSNSIGIHDFKIVKSWLVNVTTYLLKAYGDAVRTEVLQYSNKDPAYLGKPIEESTLFEIPYVLNDTLSIEEIKNRINGMRYLNSQTYTYYALRRANEWEFLQSERYTTSKKVVVVVTDGAASDSPLLETWWKKYGETGVVTAFAVGVGDYMKFIDQLRMIANGRKDGDNRVLTVGGFDELQTVISELTDGIDTTVDFEGQSADQDDETAVNNRQLGSSILALEDGSLHAGAVGMYLDSGSMVRFNVSSNASPDVTKYGVLEKALPGMTSDSYKGFAAVSGYFNGRSDGQYIAAGAPRYNMTGAVVVYKPLQNDTYMGNSFTIHPREGRYHVASYFGGCLMSVDVTGDGRDDLFIASPLYIGETYDEGRVYVYISSGNNSVEEWADGNDSSVELYGDKSPNYRFGSGMAAAGDINLDGYQDVVIGAPLADNGRGCIFIYLGMDGDISPEPSQKILASSLNIPTLQYFGHSLQGGIDIDDNGYPDILVGAPKSDSLVILKSRPIFREWSTLEFLKSSLDLFRCFQENRKNCATLRLCVWANGTSVDQIRMMYTITLDSAMSTGARFVFEDSTSSRFSKEVSVQRESVCFQHNLDMLENAKDFDTVIEARVIFDTSPKHSNTPMSSMRDRLHNERTQAELDWEKECNGLACVPNLELSLDVTLPDSTSPVRGLQSVLVIDSHEDYVNKAVKFTNTGENLLFDTKLNISYPSGISLKLNNPDQCVEEDDGPVAAVHGGTMQTYRYRNKHNVMRPGTSCIFYLTAFTYNLREEATLSEYSVNISIRSNAGWNVENSTAMDDTNVTRSFPIRYQSDLSIRRNKGDSAILLQDTLRKVSYITSIDEIGPNTTDFIIDYMIDGHGFSNIPSSDVSLAYPSMLSDKHPLLYPYKLECETKRGNAYCTCDQTNVNVYNLIIDRNSQNDSDSTDTFSQSTVAMVNAADDEAGSGLPGFEITPTNFSLSGDDIACPNPDGNHTCEVLKCNISNLYLSEVNFKVSFRLWTDSLQSIYNVSSVSSIRLKSRFKVTTEESKLVIKEGDGNLTAIEEEEEEVTLTAYQSIDVAAVNDMLWLYIMLGSLGGVILLGVVVGGLWKVGFFKSKYQFVVSEEDALQGKRKSPEITEDNNCDGYDEIRSISNEGTKSDTEQSADMAEEDGVYLRNIPIS